MSQIIASTYEMIGKTGAGGVVYLANQMRLGKRIVLKADKRNIKTGEALLRSEVDVLKELRHGYIPQVCDYFIEDGISYTVMDHVDGESLDRVRDREGKFNQAHVHRLGEQEVQISGKSYMEFEHGKTLQYTVSSVDSSRSHRGRRLYIYCQGGMCQGLH